MLPEAIGGTSPECFIPFNQKEDPSANSAGKKPKQSQLRIYSTRK